jgi:hypothetical protein
LSDKVQREDVTQLPQTTTMDLHDYWKKLAKACGVGFIGGGITIAVLERTWLMIVLGMWDLELRNWWLAPSVIFIVWLIYMVNRPKRRKIRKEVQK